MVRGQIDDERFARGLADFLETADDECRYEPSIRAREPYQQWKQGEEHERCGDDGRAAGHVCEAAAGQVTDVETSC